MKLTKKLETEIWKIYDTWMQGYLNADVEIYNSYFDEDYHFVGSTNNEEFLNKKDTTDFFRATGDQFSGMTDLRKETKTLEVFGEHVFLTHFFDAWFKKDKDWSYYGRFRFSSVMHKTKEGWRFIYQHFSMPDSKSEEGQTIGFDKVHLENQELREAIQRRTTELEQKNRELEVETALERIRAQAVAMKESSDLLNIVVTMRNEFIKLGHEAHYFWHMMWLPETYEKAMTSGDGSKIGFVMKLPRYIHGDIPLLAKWEKSKKPTVVYVMNVDESIDYVDKMVSLGDFQNIDPQAPSHDDLKRIGGLTFIMARTSHGEIGYSLPGIVKNPPKEDIDILVKFAGAFDLAHQRFLDLQKAEAQARETQIELALEKVRSRTMGMQRSVELRDTAMLLFQQVEELGINSFACGFNIWDEDKKFATAWMASKDRLQHPFKTNSAEDVYVLFHEAEKRGESLFILEQKRKELEEHYKYLVTIPEIKKQSEAGLSFPTFQIIHCAYFSKGYLMFITLEPVPDAHDIFKRFAKVFEQTYTRFLDLQKAEKQAREKEIELGLEKVRSRTMAMQHSDELQEASFLLDEQVRALGIKTWGCAFNIYGEKDSTEWFGNEAGVLPTYTVPHKGIFKEYYQKGQKGESFFIKEFSGKACADHYEYMSSLPVIGNVLKNLKKTNNGFPTYQIDHVAYFKYGYLLFITKEHAPDAHDVFKRFAKVFEQTYTRFLDLQKAEAQARESQIEAALERVRAQSNAMHQSEDLANVVTTVYEELKHLDSNILRCGIGFINEKSKNVNTWITSDLSSGTSIELTGDEPLSGHPLLESIFDYWKKQENLLYLLEGKDLIEYYKTVINIDFQKHFAKEGLDNAHIKHYYHCTMFPAGGLFVFKTSPISKEQINVLQRFTDAFNRAYTRHLDLQKAEAQAKEAQIEAALERVRSASMAMHKTKDISDVVVVYFEQLKQLNIEFVQSWITIFHLDQGYVDVWFSPLEGIYKSPQYFQMPSALFEETSIKSWKEGLPFSNISFQTKDDVDKFMQVCDEVTNTNYFSKTQKKLKLEHFEMLDANHKYGCISKSSIIEASTEEKDVLQRFAKVFEQTYTRFLDLQKAEAQAREAKIEAALERVRSRSMAMHTSEEIGDVAFVLFEQLKSLGGELWGTGFGFCEQDSKVDEFWFANENGIMPHLKIPNNVDEAHKKMYQGWKKKLELFSIEKSGKELKDHYKYMLTVPDVQPIFQGILDNGIAFPKWQKWHAAYFKYGYLLVITTEAYENEAVFKRFAKVFEQAYTRFLDLQKVEAQAREAQIETALERVRSQSMGMQTSEDLSSVTTAMFEQLKLIGCDLFATGIVFCDKHEGHVEQWHSLPDAGMMSPFFVPIDLDYIHQYRYDEWKKGTELFSIEIPSDFIEQHFQDIFNLPSAQKVLKDFQDQNTPMPQAPPWEIDYGASFKHGYLLVSSLQPFEEAEILPRFAKVFEQTYTRFLDLQKAEAQTREAQIEASLERVRSRAMAIQTSNELDEVIQIIFEELGKLDVQLMECSIATYDINPKDLIYRSAGPIGALQPKSVKLQYFDHPLLNDLYKDLENGIKYRSGELSGKILKTWWDSVFTKTDFKNAPKKFIASWKSVKSIFYSQFAIKHGFLEFLGNSPLEKDKVQLLERFTNVIDLTYSRYDDVVKAEYQAREAQIEIALERVRSQGMAMHKSDELKDVVKVIFDQMAHLKINPDHAGIVVDFEPKKDFHFWVADNQDIPAKITVPYLDLVWDIQFTEAKNKGIDFFTTQLDFEEKNSFYKKILPHIKGLTKKAKDFYLNCPGLAASTAIQKDIGLYIENFSGIPFSDEENSILMRFGKVFQQTYTRFLDLQKAEAQAKEAQIEVALERVRNRSMAMQKSSELLEAGELLWSEITKLGIDCFTSGYVLMDDEENIGWNYTPNPSTGKILEQAIGIPHKQTPTMKKIAASWKKSEQLCVVEMTRKQTIAHQTFVAEKGINFPFSAKQLVEISPKEIVTHTFNFKQGYLLIVGGKKLAQTQIDVMLRFTKVFQQTYTRFLDLQKAEAQAREAQIEHALEKVRSRTMAMQHSEELPVAANVLFTEVQNLGIPAWSCGYNILSIDKKSSTCIMSSEGEIQSPFVLPLTEHISLKPWHKAILNNEQFFLYEQGEKDLEEHYKYMESLPELKETFQQFKDADISLPTFQVNHLAKFTNGFLLFITYERVPDAHDIFQRFSKVFEQTYTRFLDLQKAEAQARESQIEAALEKVRSRTMAMQKGEELKDVVVLLYKELIALGVTNFATCGYVEINEETNKQETWVTNPGGDSLGLFHLPLTGDVHFDARYKAWKNKQTVFHQTVAGKERKNHLEYAITTFNSKEAEEMVLTQFPDPTVFYCFNFSHGYLHLVAGSQLTEEEESLLARFTRVFEQTYARFLDLEKAEAQTRTAQINLAVERVRAKALAMHKSEEIIEVVAKLKDEVMGLDIPDVVAATIFLNEGDDKVRMWDLSSLEHDDNYSEVPFDVTFKLKKTDPHLYVKRVWENPENYFVEIQEEKDFKRLMLWLREQNKHEIAAEVEDFIEKVQLKRLYHTAKKLNNGKLVIDQLNPPTDEMETILTKMGAAFDLAYKRFEDLKKAEAQTREAQIEAALEKVRSRSLAMHKPEELQEVVATVAEKLQELGVIYDAGGVILCTYFPDNKDVVHWITVDDFSTSGRYFVPYFDNPIFSEAWDSKIQGDAYFSKEFPVKAKNDFFKHAFENSDYKHMPEDYKQHVLQADKHHLSAAWSKNSAIIIPSLTGTVPSESDAEIMKRFAKVFEQAYIRFMDLQKAEAQTRESQIEAALERVRSRSMAMHKSEEMLEVIEVVAKQLLQLNLKFETVSFGKNNQEGDFKFWIASKGQPKPMLIQVPFLNSRVLNSVQDAQKKGISSIEDVFNAEENKEWSQHLIKFSALKHLPHEAKDFILNAPGFARSSFLLKSIDLYVGNYRAIPFTKEENAIFSRFAHVFEQAYTRFLDLQKSEAQTREVQIEGALEKVRSRSLAMHQSEELWDVIGEVFLQLEALKIQIDACFINIFQDNHPKDITCYIAAGGQTYKGSTFIPYDDFIIFNRLIEAREKEERFYAITMGKEEKDGWWKYFYAKASNIKVSINRKNHILKTTGLAQSVALGEHASIHMMKYVDSPYLEEENKILMRFVKAFDQVYTRFLDLKKAEAQVREAQIEASLERVRSRTLAMQKSEELAETSVVVFQQLLELGVSPNRLFIGIIKDKGQTLEAWATNEDGSKIANQFTLQSSKNKSIKKILTGWKQQKSSLVIDMKGKELQDYFQYLNKEMNIPFMFGLDQKKRVQTIAYFSGGLIGMAAPEEQPDDTIHLLERFAAVFNLTYTRFKDLKVAEANAEKAEQDLIKLQAAKKSAEEALSELQLTQTQLIQSEKMASLGELTAGIAHEIQNPLNFVNNFSEVSKELLEEMLEEIENGDMEEVKAIMDDVIQNLEKINHHGKRADGIVKGMLQHSRSSTGTKEPTNINTLADEYLRLAYHGLRAKDKSFNATLVTDFDDTIGNIKIIPQDIGRVVLNLLTNAFYVVNEKKQSNQNGYEPTVTLTTKKNSNLVTISVKDNGNGIPQKVLDKIFQPFFTTKPTGEGTGLGLSMSYDIITKGHGGDLKVETKKGEGTTFIITLPK